MAHGDGGAASPRLHRLCPGTGGFSLRAGLLYRPGKPAFLSHQAVPQRGGDAGLRGTALWDPAGPAVLDRLHEAPVLPHRAGAGPLARAVGPLYRRTLRGLLPAVPGPKRGQECDSSRLGHGHTQYAGDAAQPIPGGGQYAAGRRAGIGHAHPVDEPLYPRCGQPQRSQPPAGLRHRRPQLHQPALRPAHHPGRPGPRPVHQQILPAEAIQALYRPVAQRIPDLYAADQGQAAAAYHR